MKIFGKRQIYSVSEVGQSLSNAIAQLPFFWIEGEVVDFEKKRGHGYLQLKDELSTLNCMIWKDELENLGFMPQDGKKYLAYGNFNFSPRFGTIKFFIRRLELFGEGELLKIIEQLKTKLQKIGLFAQDRKKSIPNYPEKIGLVTSDQGDAYYDFTRFALERFPLKIYFIDCRVQGTFASKEIASAINAFNKYRLDFVVLTRGGGSLEDLMAFNDEGLALAIANSKNPIITGVGHEKDWTIADFVADARCATPTDVAKTYIPDKSLLVHNLNLQFSKNTNLLRLELQSALYTLEVFKKNAHLYLEKLLKHNVTSIKSFASLSLHLFEKYTLKTENRLNLLEQALTKYMSQLLKLDDKNLKNTLKNSYSFLKFYLKEKSLYLQNIFKNLANLSPQATLSRGYSITFLNNAVVKTKHQVELEDIVKIKLAKGKLEAEVLKKE